MKPKKHPVRKVNRRSDQPNQKANKKSEKKKGIFGCLSYCSSKKKDKKGIPKPASMDTKSSKTSKTPTKSSSIKKPVKPLKKRFIRKPVKPIEKNNESTKSETTKEEKKELLPARHSKVGEKKGSKEKLESESKKEALDSDLKKEKEIMATAIDELEQIKSKKSEDELLREDSGPEQSLLVKKFVRDGRNVLRWEYEESVPLDYSPPIGSPKLPNKEKPKEIKIIKSGGSKKMPKESKKVVKSKELLEEAEISKPKQEAKIPKETKKKCCGCCDCEGNKKLCQ